MSAMLVLIVDDDLATRQLFARALQGHGMQTAEAGSVHEAMETLARIRANAILCDFTLPAAEGTTLHARLQDTAPELADRIVFVTGWASDPMTRRLLDHTGRPVLEKPVEIADLVAAVRRAAS